MEMARSPFLFFTLVLAMSLHVCFSASASTKYGGGELISTLDLNPSECPAKCDYRCSKTKHRKDYCMSFCIPCCEECHCVPSGFYGNKDECPCYRDKKTKEGKPKCP